jgi:Protein of unknown function (DUF1579)
MCRGPGAHRAAQYDIEQVERAKAVAVAKSGKLAPLAGPISWTGTLQANAIGPGSPEGQIAGRGTGTWVNDGLYLLFAGEQTYTLGELTWAWKGHFLIGYDPAVQRYREILADNIGMGLKDCTLQDTRLTVDFPPGVAFEAAGHSIRYRQTYDWAEPGKITLTMEREVDGGDWVLTERSVATRRSV